MYTVKITRSDGEVTKKTFEEVAEAAIWAAKAAGEGYMVEMDGKKYVPTNFGVAEL